MTPRWWRALPVAAVVLAVAVAACTRSSESAQPSTSKVSVAAFSRSSTIAAGPGGRSLWLTSPDDNTVVEVAYPGLAVLRRIAVPGSPAELTRLDDGRLLVTRAQATALTVIDLARPTPKVASIDLPCGGSRAVIAIPAGTEGMAHGVAMVTCPTDDLVAVVDLNTGRSVAQISVSGRPSGVVTDGKEVTVSSAVGGNLRTWKLAAIADALGPAPAPAPGGAPRRIRPPSISRKVWTDGDRSPSALGALDIGRHGVVGVYQVVDNLRTVSAADLEAGRGGYGTPLKGRARIEPAISGACGARFADFTEPAQALSGPVAVAAARRGDLVWVVGQFSHTVAAVHCRAGPRSGRSTVAAMFHVGDGARGITLSGDGREAFVDVGFDHAVAHLKLPTRDQAADDEVLEPSMVVRRPTKVAGLTPVALEGRRMFHDATDPHLTPSGVVTCASCHPAGGDDGLRWRIQTVEIARKLRRTPPVWGLDPATKPLHWDGGFATADALVDQTVHEVMGGDGLAVDTSPISQYLSELRPPPPAPARTAGQHMAVDRGRALFESAAVGCASCHLGATGTDGEHHDVIAPSAERDGLLSEVVTPSLTGTRGRAPYFHDGRSPTLAAALSEAPAKGHHHGHAESLSPSELADLLAYLRSR